MRPQVYRERERERGRQRERDVLTLTGLLIKHYVHFNLEVGGRDKGVYQNHIIKCTLKGAVASICTSKGKRIKVKHKQDNHIHGMYSYTLVRTHTHPSIHIL